MVAPEEGDAGDDAEKTAERIGIYDSRAVVVAFVGSAVYKATAGKTLAEKMAAHKEAEANGDDVKVDEHSLAKHPDAEKTDITMMLVDILEPSEEQRKSTIEIQKHDPIPLEKMKRLDH